MTAAALKVGVQLPEVERLVRWSELASMARLAEDVGLDSLWVGDHLLYRIDGAPRGPWEAWSTLAALAAVTANIEIGPLVAATSFHNPAMLAKKAATIDEVSGGRLVLGLGAGWNEVEYRAFGFPFDRRVSRFAEAFTIIRTLLREGFIDFSGRFYEARDCHLLPGSPRVGGPPLMIGSMGRRMLGLTLPHVDAWNAWYAWYGNRPDGVGALLDLVDDVCGNVGRDPAEVERTVAVLVRMGGAGRIQGHQEGAPPVTGDAEAIARTLREFAAAGVHGVQLVLDPITLASIEALGPVMELLRAG